MRGKFITFYGINNIGKTTHAKLLVEYLNSIGREAVYVKYPVYSIEPTGSFINGVLRNSGGGQKISEEELQMWFTLNRFQFEPTLKEYLEKGVIVVAEDYVGTGLAWGSLKGANLSWLEAMNQYLLKEDLGILMEGERVMNAKEEGHIHESNDALVEKSKAIHHDLGVKFGWNTIFVQPTKEETSIKIRELVEAFLSSN